MIFYCIPIYVPTQKVKANQKKKKNKNLELKMKINKNKYFVLCNIIRKKKSTNFI